MISTALTSEVKKIQIRILKEAPDIGSSDQLNLLYYFIFSSATYDSLQRHNKNAPTDTAKGPFDFNISNRGTRLKVLNWGGGV